MNLISVSILVNIFFNSFNPSGHYREKGERGEKRNGRKTEKGKIGGMGENKEDIKENKAQGRKNSRVNI